MWPNPQLSADLVIFTEEILNGKHFLCNDVPWLSVKESKKKAINSSMSLSNLFFWNMSKVKSSGTC